MCCFPWIWPEKWQLNNKYGSTTICARSRSALSRGAHISKIVSKSDTIMTICRHVRIVYNYCFVVHSQTNSIHKMNIRYVENISVKRTVHENCQIHMQTCFHSCNQHALAQQNVYIWSVLCWSFFNEAFALTAGPLYNEWMFMSPIRTPCINVMPKSAASA